MKMNRIFGGKKNRQSGEDLLTDCASHSCTHINALTHTVAKLAFSFSKPGLPMTDCFNTSSSLHADSASLLVMASDASSHLAHLSGYRQTVVQEALSS